MKGPTNQGAMNRRSGMTTWNGHLLCAVDVETTGLDFEYSEIVELAVLPIDGTLELHKEFRPFTMWIRPENLGENDQRPKTLSDEKLANYRLKGLRSDAAADMFVKWFEGLKLPEGKKIMILAQNFPFEHKMLLNWLGPKTYEYVFHFHYRDTMSLCTVMNDISEFNGHTEHPHPKLDLGSLCTKYGVGLMDAHTANADALATLQLYKQLVRQINI